MRFFADGPCIPDLLLERRDQGRVIFLCGAGVSSGSGMPSFVGLVEHVIDYFDPPFDSPIAESFQSWRDKKSKEPKAPLDQIFQLLHQEYGINEVNAVVAKRLELNGQSQSISSPHQIIAKISSDQNRKPQIVTTNFDLLFEQIVDADVIKFFEPPAFPDIDLGMPLTGITYLHGRLKPHCEKHHPYVLSSADFGRAYLAEAWATNFIRALLKHYTVVLVGYQAEEPAVKYLLQGLNHDDKSDRSNLYAFDKGKPEHIEAKWRDRGVTAIAYQDHPDLWKSLAAWAQRAENPRGWRLKVLDMARRGPRKLEAFERGQVFHLGRTTPGARLFATSQNCPPAEWLCVFDASCRYGKKVSSGFWDDEESFDPFEVYGLDDDLPRSLENGINSPRLIHDDLFKWRMGDANPPNAHRLAGWQLGNFAEMPPRLRHLMNWVAGHLDSPVTAWWAMRQNGLHPELVERIRINLKYQKNLSKAARRVWNFILEYQMDDRNFPASDTWGDMMQRVKMEGWNASVIREFEAATAPRVIFESPYGLAASKPPSGSWDDTSLHEIGAWKVKLAEAHEKTIPVPDDVLLPMFCVVERNLFRAVELLQDVDISYIDTPSCYLDRGFEDDVFEQDLLLRLFLELFSRMYENLPTILCAHVLTWPEEDRFYFKKLKLFALNHANLFSPEEAVEAVIKLDQEDFWHSDFRRELICLLKDRWDEFSENSQEELAGRLFHGPDRRAGWEVDDYPDFQSEMAFLYMRWLSFHGLTLPQAFVEKMDQLAARFPELDDSAVEQFFARQSTFATLVKVDESPDCLIDLPVHNVVDKAKEDLQQNYSNGVEKRSFSGLVEVNPRKAILALSCSAKQNDYPERLWSCLIEKWPDNASPRLNKIFLLRLGMLPQEVICKLRHSIGRWFVEGFLKAYEFDNDIAWRVFDHLVAGLFSGNGVATTSAIGISRVNGEVAQYSRRTLSHAISSSIGKAMEGVIKVIDSHKLGQGAVIPDEFKSRMEMLILAPGEGGDHAVAILTRQILWLNYIDPQWVIKRIVPWFDFDNSLSEPAWNGFFSAAKMLPEELGILLKPRLLEIFPKIYEWSWRNNLARVASQIIVFLAVHHAEDADGLTSSEARNCLRKMNDRERCSAVFHLSEIAKDQDMINHVISFINQVWPRERALRTSALVSAWVSLLQKAGDNFPSMFDAVRKFLVHVEEHPSWLYHFSRHDDNHPSLTAKYPETVLDLMDLVIPDNKALVFYELQKVLDLIVETDPSLTQDRRYLRLINLIEMA